jgi:hypothetical protein
MRLPKLISAGLSHLRPDHIAHVLFFLAIIGLAILYALPDTTTPTTAGTKQAGTKQAGTKQAGTKQAASAAPTAAPESKATGEPAPKPIETPADPHEPVSELQAPGMGLQEPDNGARSVVHTEAVAPSPIRVEERAAELESEPTYCYPRYRRWWRCR